MPTNSFLKSPHVQIFFEIDSANPLPLDEPHHFTTCSSGFLDYWNQ